MIRTPEGRRFKENPDVTENMHDKVRRFKQAVKRAEILGTLESHPAWQCIQDMLNERVNGIDAKLKKFQINDQRTNDFLLQEKEVVVYLRDIVKDMTSSVPGFEASIAQLERELESRKHTDSD